MKKLTIIPAIVLAAMLVFCCAFAEGVQPAGTVEMSLSEAELNGTFCGSWLEDGNQFTALTIAQPTAQGYPAQAVSPMTHGAYLYTMTLTWDNERGAMVYTDGTVYDILPDSDPADISTLRLRASDVSGELTLVPGADEGAALLSWRTGLEDMAEVVFRRNSDPLAALAGQTYELSSGVGAWSAMITFGENGAFTGVYHDSEMGEAADDYPNGTVYGCLFHGQAAVADGADGMLRLTVTELAMDEGQVPEAIEDGIRYVTTDPYGLAEGDVFTLFPASTALDGFSDDFIFWSHARDLDPEATVLPCAFLWNEAGESGFVYTETDADID